MKVSLSSWIQRWLYGSNHRRRIVKQTAACLAISLATAWVAPSEAATIHLEVAPAQDITNAWVGYLNKNTSSAYFYQLGTLPGGQISAFDTEFPGVPISDFISGPPPDPFLYAAYCIVGVYSDGTVNGITASSADDAPIVNGDTWDSHLGHYFGSHDEQNVADTLASGSSFWVSNFENPYTDVQFGTQAVLVNYSTAAFGGTAIATVVPEPCTWALLSLGAGAWLCFARRHRD